MVRVALLDRDGVLNRDRPDYIKKPAELEVFPFARDAVARLRAAGWLVYVVSNQAAVGHGLVSRDDVAAVAAAVEGAVGPLDGAFYCYHRPEDGCDCRKPEPGMLLAALADAGKKGPVETCWMVGDTERDLEAGRRAGCRTVLVLSGRLDAATAAALAPPPDAIAEDLAAAADIILGE